MPSLLYYPDAMPKMGHWVTPMLSFWASVSTLTITQSKNNNIVTEALVSVFHCHINN